MFHYACCALRRILKNRRPLSFKILTTALTLSMAVSGLSAEVINYATYPQLTEIPVTIPEGEMTLESALKSIESQTEFRFMYLASDIPVSEPVKFTGDTISLSDMLFKITEAAGVVFTPTGNDNMIAIRMQTADDEIDYGGAMAMNLEDGPGGEVIMLDSFDVDSQEFKSGSEQLSMERKVSTGMMNFLSLEDMSKFGGSDLSEVINRMVGVNVVEGRFAVVRGLGDRYVSTLVNGLPMPSPDPMRQGVQLDLFPTSIIEEVVVHKNALPNMPMNSAAAAFDLRTKQFSEDFTAWFEAGYSVNSNAMDEYLRLDNDAAYSLWPYSIDGFDPMPGNFGQPYDKDNANQEIGINFGDTPVTPSFKFGFSDTFEVLDHSKLKVVFATSYDTGATTATGWEQERIATVGSGIYNKTLGAWIPAAGVPGSVYSDSLEARGLYYDLTRSDYEVLFGGLVGLAFQIDEDGDHEIYFNTLYSQSTNSRAQRLANGHYPAGQAQVTYDLLDGQPATAGYTPINWPPGMEYGVNTGSFGGGYFPDIIGLGNGDLYYLNEDISIFEERNLTAFQLGGDHTFEELGGLRANWGLTMSSTTSDVFQSVLNYFTEPSTGEYIWADNTSMEYPGTASELAMQQTWRDLSEDTYGARLDLAYDLPFWGGREWTLEGGAFFQDAKRTVTQADVFYSVDREITGTTLEEYINQVVEHGVVNTGSGAVTPPVQPSWADVSRTQTAGYLMGTFPLLEQLSFTGGARLVSLQMSSKGGFTLNSLTDLEDLVNYEYDISSTQQVSLAEYIGYPDTGEGNINKNYILPSGVMTWDVTDDFIIRGGGSMTVVLPSMRELSPYFSLDDDFNSVLGNPGLKPSDVYSVDLRFEYYFNESALVALNFFYKWIQNPIEKIAWYNDYEGTFYTYFNNPVTATTRGVEFEFRTDLDLISDELENFNIGINLAYIDARVPLSEYTRLAYYNAFSNPGLDVDQGVGAGPYGINNIPEYNRMQDQPEWTANADLTWINPDWGSRLSLILYAQSDVLSSLGSPVVPTLDQYYLPFYELKFVYAQELWEGMTMKFSVSNITDTERGMKYSSEVFSSPPTYQSFHVGQTYELKFSYEF
jgi:TonB-dependent receptor